MEYASDFPGGLCTASGPAERPAGVAATLGGKVAQG